LKEKKHTRVRPDSDELIKILVKEGRKIEGDWYLDDQFNKAKKIQYDIQK
jgi:hypothetical protein